MADPASLGATHVPAFTETQFRAAVTATHKSITDSIDRLTNGCQEQGLATYVEVLRERAGTALSRLGNLYGQLEHWAAGVAAANADWASPHCVPVNAPSLDQQLLKHVLEVASRISQEEIGLPILTYLGKLSGQEGTALGLIQAWGNSLEHFKPFDPRRTPLAERIQQQLDGFATHQELQVPPNLKGPTFSQALQSALSPQINAAVLTAKDGLFFAEQMGPLPRDFAGMVNVGRNHGAVSAGTSRTHASLRWEGPHLMLRDLGSTNGTFVYRNEAWEKVSGDGTRLHAGDLVAIGSTNTAKLDDPFAFLIRVPSGPQLPARLGKQYSPSYGSAIETALKSLSPGETISIGTALSGATIKLSGTAAAALDPLHLTIQRLADVPGNSRVYSLVDGDGKQPSLNGIVVGGKPLDNYRSLQLVAGASIELPAPPGVQPVRFLLPTQA